MLLIVSEANTTPKMRPDKPSLVQIPIIPAVEKKNPLEASASRGFGS
jgi:hypothetical protein